jgi:hypothetical protein
MNSTYFDIAKNWATASDDEVLSFKKRLVTCVKEFDGCDPAQLKVSCSTNGWIAGNVCEVTVMNFDRKNPGRDAYFTLINNGSAVISVPNRIE